MLLSTNDSIEDALLAVGYSNADISYKVFRNSVASRQRPTASRLLNESDKAKGIYFRIFLF